MTVDDSVRLESLTYAHSSGCCCPLVDPQSRLSADTLCAQLRLYPLFSFAGHFRLRLWVGALDGKPLSPDFRPGFFWVRSHF